jgi:hypothetical protein
MFETSQEVLILLLVGLGAALSIIVILILRKQRQIKGLQEGDAAPEAPQEKEKPPEEKAMTPEEKAKPPEQDAKPPEEKEKSPEEKAQSPEEKAKAPEKETEEEGGLQYAFADEEEGEEEGQTQKPEQAETGPTDIESIKASIVPGSDEQPSGSQESKEPQEEEAIPTVPFGEEDAQTAVDSGVEEGVELDQDGMVAESFQDEKGTETPADEDAQPSGELPVEEKPPAAEPVAEREVQ